MLTFQTKDIYHNKTSDVVKNFGKFDKIGIVTGIVELSIFLQPMQRIQGLMGFVLKGEVQDQSLYDRLLILPEFNLIPPPPEQNGGRLSSKYKKTDKKAMIGKVSRVIYKQGHKNIVKFQGRMLPISEARKLCNQ
jgi:hypothetical protein